MAGLKEWGQFFIKLQVFVLFFILLLLEKDQILEIFNVTTIKVDSNKKIVLNFTRSHLIACNFSHNFGSSNNEIFIFNHS